MVGYRSPLHPGQVTRFRADLLGGPLPKKDLGEHGRIEEGCFTGAPFFISGDFSRSAPERYGVK